MRIKERRQNKEHGGIEKIVVLFIGWTLYTIVLGVIVLSGLQIVNGEWLKDIALVLVGALGTLLTNITRASLGSASNPTSTTIVNPTSDPVPVASTEEDK